MASGEWGEGAASHSPLAISPFARFAFFLSHNLLESLRKPLIGR
jgi:hypothetical protein